MANKKVTLYRNCKTPSGWQRYPAAMSANGRLKPNAVTVGDVEVAYPVGRYELRSFEGSKTKWVSIDGNAKEAMAALKAAQQRANAVAMADDAGVQVVEDTIRISLRDSYPRFVQAARDRGSIEAAEIYKRSLEEFLAGCTKTYADQITKEDVTKFHVQMKARGLSARTVSNRHMNLRAFLVSLGLDVKAIAGKAPRYDKTLPEIFEPHDLTAFFPSLEADYDALLFTLLLKTGLREAEAMHLQWVDISYARRTLQVRAKPQYDHRIKDAEERELPIPEDLVAQLQAYRLTIPASHKLVFGKRGGLEDAPDGHLLRRLKSLAKKANLNCGQCASCGATKECERWFLHKFRATFCTTLLRSKIDLRTVQRLMGHSDLASTTRYLRPAGTVEIQDKVNAVTWY